MSIGEHCTDRDLVVEGLAQEVDPNTVTLADIMTLDLVTAREDDERWDGCAVRASAACR